MPEDFIGAREKMKAAMCIIMATRLEAEPFFGYYALEKIVEKPVPVYRGSGVILAVSGIGKVNAAIATAFCCERFQPRLILNLGAAGATVPLYRSGDILHISKVVEYDRLGLRTGKPHVHAPDELVGFNTAVLATQDRPVVEGSHRAEVSSVADLVDMEGTAVVQTAHRFGVRCYLFKFISDTPGDEGHTDIVASIKTHRLAFCTYVSETVLPCLANSMTDLPR